MPRETPVRVVRELASRGYNAEREAVTLLAGAPDPERAVERAVESLPADAITVSTDHVRSVLDGTSPAAAGTTDAAPDGNASADGNSSDTTSTENPVGSTPAPPRPNDDSADPPTTDPPTADAPDSTGNTSVSTGRVRRQKQNQESISGGETRGVSQSETPSEETPATRSNGTEPDSTPTKAPGGTSEPVSAGNGAREAAEPRRPAEPAIDGDITGESTGTGDYRDFVTLFRDRYEKLAGQLRSRVNHRPTNALEAMPGGSDAAVVGMINDIRSTAGGHWLVELEDTNGVFPCLVLKDREIAGVVDELICDEVIAVEGTLADDGDILFADSLYFPDVPRTYRPSTADRHVQAALVSDIHVGSQEFEADAWSRFADWLHTEEAQSVEYLLIAGDMVEGVGVYPDQDEELDIVDIYEQYATFSEHLKEVPGDVEVVMIPGNHDAVRLAEPQPAFDEELRDIMSAHDARITGNPSLVTVEGVSVLMYHGVSLDEVIAELPAEKASYDEPQKAMYQLLKKRHVAPQYGGKLRMAPEKSDHLVIDEVPDVFHTGHVHKLGLGKYHNVTAINSGCWQAQTAFQRSVNIDPDVGYAPILDLDTLDVTLRKFR